MLKGKTAKIIKIVVSLLLLIPCCSKNEAETKIYRTTIGEPILSMYADPKNPTIKTFIMNIPFKSKVEVVDNKSIDEYIKVKYEDTVGYVYKGYLSEKDDIPFIKNVKYDLSIHEFDYDRKSVIETLKKFMLNFDFFYNGVPTYYKIPYYYIDDPQMFSLYGKDSNCMEMKIVAVIMNSKIMTSNSRIICFIVENNELIFRATLPVEVENEMVVERQLLEYLKNPNCAYRGR